jgi:class II lanthipeptide synthase
LSDRGSSYREQVAGALDAIRILSPTAYSWFGRRSQPLSRSSRARLDERAAAECLTVALQHQLYADFYTLGEAAPVTDSLTKPGRGPIEEHTEQLSQANCGTGYWDRGWTIVGFPATGVVEAAKRGLKLLANLGDVDSEPNKMAIGQTVALRLPKEEIGISPGYYTAAGGESLVEEGVELYRLYWNLSADDSIRLMRRATGALARTGLAFRLKVLKDPSAYRRADAAVLYFRRADADAMSAVVQAHHPTLIQTPRLAVPAFTLRIAPGLGLAEDPGGKQSFGLHRCRLMAEGIVRAHHARATSARERLECVEARFLQEGVLLERPYVKSTSPEPRFSVGERHRRNRKPTAVRKSFDGQACRAAAVETGRTLCREASWDVDVCNWTGVIPDPNAVNDSLAISECRTLGPDLYSGTSGIAMFLAQLYAAEPDAEFRRTALGAIRHALLRADAPATHLRFGLYTGWSGIVLAALRVGRLLRHRETLAGARRLARRLMIHGARGLKRESDLLSGKAGAILLLLLVWREWGWSDARDVAVRLGHQLLRDARQTSAGYSWASVNIPRRRNLTGLSHGAAGVGLALLELGTAVNDASFRAAAIRAFEYERHHFDRSARNWPDFRQADSGTRKAFATSWCNGAPGIGLSRRRAFEILQDDACREEAVTAFETTRDLVRQALDARDPGFCLCHGLAGNADVLIDAKQMLGEAWSRSLTWEVAAHMRAPPGTPGLMLGRAGVGYFLLRAADPDRVPSVLLITSNWLRARH